MIKMNVSAETFDGDMVTETLWFHMNKVDLIELQQSEPGGFTDTLQAFMSRKAEDWTMSDKFKLFDFFRTMVDKAYGERSSDGKRFRKSPEILANFKDSIFYDEFVLSLLEDEEKSIKFFNGVMPKSLIEQAKKERPDVFKTIEA
jgi:gp065